MIFIIDVIVPSKNKKLSNLNVFFLT